MKPNEWTGTTRDDPHWATEARHLEAKKRGRAAFYAEYTLQVCEVVRESTFRHEPAGAQLTPGAETPRS